jgi:hypothetical protein
MSRLDATALSIVLALFAPRAAAQSGFRPLPHLPSLAPALAPAEPPAPEDAAATDGAPEPVSTTLDARIFAAASAEGDLEGGGAMSTQRGGWAATLGRRLDGERVAALELCAEAYFYDFSGASVLSPSNSQPFNDLYRATVCGQLRTQIDERVSYFAGVELELAGEEGASFTDSLSVGAAGGVTVTRGEHLSLSLGLAALSQLEDDPWIWPWLGFEWQASDWLELSAHGTDLAARARLSESLTGVALVEYTLRQFRLSEDNPISDGAFRDEDIRASLGLEWHVDQGVELSLFGGFSAWRELTSFDDAGHAIETEVDPSPFVAFSLDFSL